MKRKLTFNEIKMFFAGMGEQVKPYWLKKFDNDDKFIYWVPDYDYANEWRENMWFGQSHHSKLATEYYYSNDVIHGAFAVDYTMEDFEEIGRCVLLIKRGIESRFGDRFDKLEWLKDKNG